MRRLFRLWRLSGRDLRILFAAARHPHRPRWLILALLAVAFFALEPVNFAAPMMGIVDDLVLLPLLLRILARLAMAGMDRMNDRSREDRVVLIQ